MSIMQPLREKGHPDAGYKVDELWGHYAKQNKPNTKRKILSDFSLIKYLKQSQS
jgi:hypothetical protein